MGYYDKFNPNVPEISGYADESAYEPIPYGNVSTSYDIVPNKIDYLSVGQDIGELDPNVPANKSDISFLLSQMGGRYDDQGYYGLSQGQIESARRAGLGALGANIAMGALSGTWQGFGEGNIKGLMAEKAQREAAMQSFSDRNLAADKQKIDFEKEGLSIENAKLELSNKKEDARAKAESRKAALAAWRSTAADRDAEKAQMEPAERKAVELKEKQVEMYFAAGNPEKAMEVAATIQSIGPTADNYRDKKAREDAVKAAETKAVAEGAGRKVSNEEAVAIFNSLGGKNSGYGLETDKDGNTILVSPHDYDIRRQQAAAANDLAESRRDTAAYRRAQREKLERDNIFGVLDGNMKMKDIRDISMRQSNALHDYNRLVGTYGRNAPAEAANKPIVVDQRETDRLAREKVTYEKAVEELTSRGYGLLKPEDVGLPLPNWNEMEVQQRVITYGRALQEENRRILSAQGTITPPPPSQIQATAALAAFKDAVTTTTLINQVKAQVGKPNLTYDEFLATLEASYPGFIAQLQADKTKADMIKKGFEINTGTGRAAPPVNRPLDKQ